KRKPLSSAATRITLNTPDHGHIHFDGYALYNLRLVLPDGGVGPLVATSDKVSFCLLDFALFDSDIPGAPAIPQFTDCEVSTQGISVGWADVYPADIPDQWIDVEDVPPGEYWFETVIDPFNLIKESNDDNNSMQTRVVIGATEYAPDQFDAAENPRTALGIGDHTFESLSIHEPGDVDTFSWIATDDGTLNVDVEFDESLGDIDLYVVVGGDAVGELTVDEAGEHATVEVTEGVSYRIIIRSLEARTNPSYSLSIDGPDILPDAFEENDSLDTATVLDSDDQHLSDLTIHSPGGSDFFAWTATETGMLHIDVQFSAAEGVLELTAFDVERQDEAEGPFAGSPLVMEFDVVEGQTYFFQVKAQEGDYSKGYELTLDYLEIEADPFEPNDHNFTPVDIGSGSMELLDLTVHRPFNRDFFRWKPAGVGSLDVSLLFDHEASDLDLIIWEQGESVYFLTSETDNELTTIDVDPNVTYMFEIKGKTGQTSPRYSLILDGPEPPRIESVMVGGSQRAGDSFQLLDREGEIPTAPIAPWDGVDQVHVTFTKDVSLAEDDWQIVDSEDEPIDLVSYTYDSETRTGTWLLPDSQENGELTLEVFDTVVDSESNSLDGEWSLGDSFPSGDGTLGGHFEFTFEILVGDVTADGVVDVDDLDTVSDGVRQGDVLVDIDGDGVAASADRQRVLDILGVRPGDADLSGMFTSTDLIIVFQASEYEDDQPLNSTWSEGDWNGDGEFDSSDLIVAFQAGYDELPPAARPATRPATNRIASAISLAPGAEISLPKGPACEPAESRANASSRRQRPANLELAATAAFEIDYGTRQRNILIDEAFAEFADSERDNGDGVI
ncbi:lysyl oxidase family protein, partial [Planctomycetota bacterium]